MGQIQKATEGLVNKLLVTKAGSDLIKSNKEVQAMEAKVKEIEAQNKAYEAQDKASEYFDTEVKKADRASLDADKALGEAYAKRNELGNKYGAEFEPFVSNGGSTGERVASVDESKMSKNPLTQKSQMNRLVMANYDYNVALKANTAATNQLNLKKDQYEAFKERAELLSKKAGVPMSKALSPEAEKNKRLVWTSEWMDENFLKGGKKNG